MVRVHVLRGVIASGQRLVAGTAAEISDGDARILIRANKVILAPETLAPLQPPEVHETAEAPMRETATRSRRRKATLQ